VEWREIGRRAITAWNRDQRPFLPKCSAKAKQTGERCKQTALPNGKCYVHGGRTPSGDEWHRMQLKGRGASLEAAERKLRTVKQRRKKRAAAAAERAASMTPEELADLERRRKAARPGTLGERGQRSRDRAAAKRFAELRDAERPPSAAVAALRDATALLRADVARKEAELKAAVLEAPGAAGAGDDEDWPDWLRPGTAKGLFE